MGIVMKKNENSEITQEELMYLSRQFANMFAFPVRLYHNKDKIYLAIGGIKKINVIL